MYSNGMWPVRFWVSWSQRHLPAVPSRFKSIAMTTLQIIGGLTSLLNVSFPTAFADFLGDFIGACASHEPVV